MTIFQVWREQIGTELAEAKGEMAAAVAAVTGAEASAATLEASFGELQSRVGCIARHDPNVNLSSALQLRLSAESSEVKAAASAVRRAQAMVEAVGRQIADLSLAVSQLDFIDLKATELAAAEPEGVMA
jgi:hypothetical protein